jgi:hypothetical protein
MTDLGLFLEATAAAAQAGRDAAAELATVRRPGVVLSVDPTNTVAVVQPDGPEGETSGGHGASIIAPVTLTIGDRVMLAYEGTSPGCYVVGRLSGDWGEWHIVGNEGEPQFDTGWGPASGTTIIGGNGPAQPAFTMRSGRVELRGRAHRSSGVANNVFKLPEYAWPENDLLMPCVGTGGAVTVFSVLQANGQVAGSGNADVIMDGVSFIARIQQPTE